MTQQQPHEIVIVITPDGKIESTVNGVDGPSCAELTKWLEELGAVVEDNATGDYYKLPKQGVGLRR